MSTIVIEGSALVPEQVAQVAYENASVELSAEAAARVQRSRAVVEQKLAGDEPVYGVNTGFGYLKNKRIPKSDLAQLQLNLIRSHAVGVGTPLSIPQTRALMLLRVNVLATGRSGIRLQTLERLIAMLNLQIHPIIPGKGSVGASGDLAPLAHLALGLIGEGAVHGEHRLSTEAWRAAGLSPAELGPKEGLCLVNGTQAMTGVGVLALLEAECLADEADIVGSVSLEGRRGTTAAFDPKIQAARPHPGQSEVAARIQKLTQDSEIAESHRSCGAIQDPYSFRCMPQVHGAVRDVLRFVRQTLTIEMNAATDNPLVFAEAGEGDVMLSGGNFHGQPIAFALDFLAMAVAELASISERRVEQLVDPALSGLPPFLTEASGLNSGFMMAQVTAASLVNENRILCTPASVDSIPTSANQEDHVSMGMTSARKALTVLENTRTCLAIELLCGCQATDLVGLKPGRGTDAVQKLVRTQVPKLEQDRALHHDIEAVTTLLSTGAVRDATQGLA